VLYVPFLGEQKSRLENVLPNIGKETIERSICEFTYFDKKDSPDSTEYALKGSIEEDFALIQSKIEKMTEESGKPVLAVLSQDALEGFYGYESIAKSLPRSIARFKNLGAICFEITSSGSSFLQELRAFCDVGVRMEMIHDTPVAFAVRPSSVLYGLTRDPEAPGKMALVPIL